MVSRKSQATVIEPSLSPARARTAIRNQLASICAMRGQRYDEAEGAEREWVQFTRSIVERTFGNPSSALLSFSRAKSAGEYYMVPFGSGINHDQNQRNFEARIQALESCLNAYLAELDLISPESEIAGIYAPGHEYEFYRDIRSILSTATTSIMIIDPYLNREIFEVYVDGIDRSVRLRILTHNPPCDALTIATKYAAGGNLALGTSTEIHDRVIFADGRVWMVGQSLKDAAKRKPTYIVEHDAVLILPLYEAIWGRATVLI